MQLADKILYVSENIIFLKKSYFSKKTFLFKTINFHFLLYSQKGASHSSRKNATHFYHLSILPKMITVCGLAGLLSKQSLQKIISKRLFLEVTGVRCLCCWDFVKARYIWSARPIRIFTREQWWVTCWSDYWLRDDRPRCHWWFLWCT